MSEPDLRIGDAERDATAALLAHHFAAGRLSRSEFDERTEQVLVARTRSQVDHVVVDLPSTPGERPSTALDAAGDAEDSPGRAAAQWRRGMLAPWMVFSVFFVVLWAVTGGGYFWPMWPIMGWGIGVVMSGIRAHAEPSSPWRARSKHRPGPFAELGGAPGMQNMPRTPRLQGRAGGKRH